MTEHRNLGAGQGLGHRHRLIGPELTTRGVASTHSRFVSWDPWGSRRSARDALKRDICIDSSLLPGGVCR